MKDKTTTTTTTHTPGPWDAREGPSGDLIIEMRSQAMLGPMIATVSRWNTVPDERAEALANAHLIAAAPELLAALKAMLHADECISENRGHKSDQAMQRIAAIDLATAAIARAEGGGK